jgi:hypothetical protein
LEASPRSGLLPPANLRAALPNIDLRLRPKPFEAPTIAVPIGSRIAEQKTLSDHSAWR